MVTRDILSRRAVSIQLYGYGVLLLCIVGDEVFDIPHTVFGFPATPINWFEAGFEGVLVILLGSVSMVLTRRFLRQIKFLEGFLSICSYCKKIRVDQEWRPLEGYISEHAEVLFSHGLCPECLEKHYGEYMHPSGAKPSEPDGNARW